MKINWVKENFLFALPVDRVEKISEWGRKNVTIPKSARSKSFNPDITPWILEPMNDFDLPERRQTIFIKPVQCGGSTLGEVIVCYILSCKGDADIQYNWQNDEKAKEIWKNRFERILKNCNPVMENAPSEIHKNSGNWSIGNIQFPNCTFTMQGVNSLGNVASLSVKYQINEELHVERDGWQEGRIEQAFARTTAYDFHQIMCISNAGRKGGELESAFEAGFQKHWEVKCPGCKKYHVMRTRWVDKEPDKGGLRYNSDDCVREDGSYDYVKLAATIRFQMPCGFTILDGDVTTRKQLSQSGRYGKPRNPGAAEHIASYTFEAVSVDYISWLSLIMQKHSALKARRYGDSMPWLKYLRERECVFSDEDDFPSMRSIQLSKLTKDRDGLPDRDIRVCAVDRQKGEARKNEFPHYWICICDVKKIDDGRLRVLVVYEGKIDSDESLIEIIFRHEVTPRHVVIDSGWDTMHIYHLCLKHGFHSVKGESRNSYTHTKKKLDGSVQKSFRIFSEFQPIHRMVGQPKSRDKLADEPRFWRYSKDGLADRYAWLSSGGNGLIDFEVPADVSDDFLSHHNAWEVQEIKVGTNIKRIWVRLQKRDDLWKCMHYVTMLIEMAGFIGIEIETEEKEE